VGKKFAQAKNNRKKKLYTRQVKKIHTTWGQKKKFANPPAPITFLMVDSNHGADGGGSCDDENGDDDEGDDSLSLVHMAS